MKLTTKQRVKVNAALSMIYAASSITDANEVIAAANAHKASGHDERKAYELAINAWAIQAGDLEPELSGGVAAMLNLIEASDDQTVAKYEVAINAYIATGDEAGINALAPMIAEDGQALGLSTGKLTAADIASGESPFGMLAAAVGPPAQASQVPQPSPIDSIGQSTVSLTSGNANPEGQMSARTAQRWAAVPVSGQRVNASPFAAMTPAQAREGARSAAMGNGRAILPAVAPVAAVIG